MQRMSSRSGGSARARAKFRRVVLRVGAAAAGPAGSGEMAEGPRSSHVRWGLKRTLPCPSTSMQRINRPTAMLSRHLRAIPPCPHVLCNQFAGHPARLPAPPSARLPQVRTFSTHPPVRQARPVDQPAIGVTLKDRAVAVQLPDGRTTSL